MKKKSIKIANSKDVRFLFNIYNTRFNEEYSKTKKKIKYTDHKSWFHKELKSKDSKIYILYYDNNKIGSIRINIFKFNTCLVSIYIKRSKRFKRFGSFYLSNVLKKIKDKLNINNVYAEVLKKNKTSKHFFTKNKFRLIKYSKKFSSKFKKNNYIFLKKIK
mgnify:CR=1 FL=1